MVDFDPADRETDKRKRRRFVAPMGGNIGNDGEGFYFHIRGATNPEGIPTSKIAFEGGAVPLDADELMGPPKAEKRLDAAQFICGQLKDGPKPRHKVLEQGRAEGFSAETLRRAQRDVRPHGYNDEKLGGWVWELRK